MDCTELLSGGARERLAKGKPTGTVNRNRFWELHEEGRKLVHDWAVRASTQIECADQDSFEPFIFGWIALNGWASCVTGEDEDAKCLDALVCDAELASEFSEQLETGLLKAARNFQSLWPIFSSNSIGHNAAWTGTRDEVIRQHRAMTPLPRHRPACVFRHTDLGEEVPPDWPHTLSAIYQVRCNLFHGYKGVHSENDVLIVSRAFRVLVRLLPMLIPNLEAPHQLNPGRAE